MSNASLSQQILQEVQLLSDVQQRQVLAFMRQLQQSPRLSGAALIELVGTIPSADLDLMEKAIEEGCEQIDPEGS